jgi:galactokinase
MSTLVERFAAHFGRPAQVLARAPGRLEILGNHTDYNQGFVLSCAVGQSTEVALAPTGGRICRLKDFRDGSEKTFSLDSLGEATPRNWSNYIRGVIAELRKRGLEVGGFDAGMLSEVPLSAGMSSSAALETAFGFAFAEAFALELAPMEWARVGQGVENHYLGLKSGLLDQFSSIFGRRDAMILSDFRSCEVLRTVPLPPGYSIAVVNSMVKHNLVDSEYNTRRQDCESAAAKLSKIYPGVATLRDVSPEQLEAAKDRLDLREYRRARHVVGENDRVMRAVELLAANDMAGFGRLWLESHESSRVNFENSTPELDYLVELAGSIPGCLGARLSGGGFGGISIHLVEDGESTRYLDRISAAFRLRRGVKPETIVCRIGDGASVRRLCP